MDEDEELYLDPAATQTPQAKSFKNLAISIIFRLPSIILADLILLHADYLIIESQKVFEPILSFSNDLVLLIISRIFIVICLFTCLQLFALKLRYAANIYKLLALLSLPFVFKTMINYARYNKMSLFFFNISSAALVSLVYIAIFSITVLLYSEIYVNCIVDTENIHDKYQMKNDQNEETYNQHLETLLEQDTSSSPANINVNLGDFDINNEIKQSLIYRRMYTFLYFTLSVIFNEFYFFYDNSVDRNNPQQDFNFISIGYLLLFFYDMYSNIDQLILRFLIKVKYLGNLINEYGINNILSFNWFDRLRVPFMLRSFFIFKCLVFAINFFLHYKYYFDLDQKTETNAVKEEKKSLVFYVSSLFKDTNNSSALENVNHLEQNESTVNFFKAFEYILHFDYVNEYSSVVLSNEVVKLFIKMLILNLSDTFISISCVTSMLALKFNFLGRLFASLTFNRDEAQANQNESLKVGDVAAIFFFILSIQTGLSSLRGQQRIERLFKNYSLLFIAILHYFHTSLDTQLMQLSASSLQPYWRNKKHIRPLLVFLLLFITPIAILTLLWQRFVVSTWFLAAIAFNIELIIKMMVTIVQYGLYMYESQRISASYQTDEKPDDLTNNLDDVIYYVKSFGHVTEFVIALFLFFNGVYILLFESYGGIRAIMICIHAYFHIYLQAKKGIETYLKRRTANEKLNRLDMFSKENINVLASRERISNEDDESIERDFRKFGEEACAICFSEINLHEARITNCKHLFHSTCLKKWLYLQDTCPMCHSIVYPTVN